MSANKLKRRGRRREKASEWAAAAAAYRAALAKDARDPDLWYRLGRTLEQQQDWIGAATAIREAIVRHGGSGRWYFRLGGALERAGNVGEAREAYRRAESLSGFEPSLKGVRGRQLSYQERIDLGIMPKASYAYLLFRGAGLAKRLGVKRISAVELGVAGGNGLVAMERHAADIEAMTGVSIDVYGFDTGEGLVAPRDHRDLPYRFAEGTFVMDVDKLRARLERAELVLGDAAETFAEFLDNGPAPLGAISLDMDLYAPTRAVLDTMGDEASERRFLPRVPLYFDDVVGNREQDYNEFTGELLAIREFNEENSAVKVAEDRHFWTLPINEAWHHGIYTMHRFAHPEYDTYVRRARARSLALKA